MVILMNQIIGFLIFGGLGALAKDVVQDNKIQLPRYENGYLVLGFIGGMLVGAFVGYAIDQSYLMALLSGYVGTSAIKHLLPSGDSG